jgi:peroxiredoxin
MIPLGTQAPDFVLPNALTGKTVRLLDIKSKKATVVMFICNHCPFVKHIIEPLVALADDYSKKGIQFIAINSNDISQFPEDSPENMQAFAAQYNINFPYLYDESQEVARHYDAACTPDFFVFDNLLHLVYRGQFDDARPGSETPVTGDCLARALDAILNGDKVSELQYPSVGCNIKWRN